MLKKPIALCLTILLCVSACGSFDQLVGKSTASKDSAPSYKVDPANIKDAIPREGAVTRAGNKNPYTVLGKTYHLLPTSKSYREQGTASWYGTKFQGRPTANGEPYNLYAMTAAHKTLPIPAYVKVTNLDNQRTAIVRVNDRGPFHDQRIIDLSYAAAVKLGYAEKGTARVLVESIDVTSSKKAVVKSEQGERYFLQVGAFSSIESANNLRRQLQRSIKQPVLIQQAEVAVADNSAVASGLYRVRLGPMVSMALVDQVSKQLAAINITQPRLITD